jgi:hypothetical protein
VERPADADVGIRVGAAVFTEIVVALLERTAATGMVVALSAVGLDDVRGVMAITRPATATKARVPTARAARWCDDPVSTSALVGPSSDGCRHVRS